MVSPPPSLGAPITPSRYGIVSFVIGALSLPTAFAFTYAQSMKGSGSSFLFDWFASKGLIKENPYAVPMITEPSIFLVTDDRALTALFAIAVGSALLGMGLAPWAEYRRESTLYFSGGYVVGALALFLIRPTVGFVSLIAGIAIAVVMRHGGISRDT
jgi:hypothetical protein